MSEKDGSRGNQEPEGMSNSLPADDGPGGMVSEVELVNGLPHEVPERGPGKVWPPGSKGRRRASERVVAEKAADPLPGSPKE